MRCSCALEAYHAQTAWQAWELLSTAPDSCAPVPESAHPPARLTDGSCRVNHCRSRRTSPACLPRVTSEAARSSAVQRRLARDRWPSLWCTSVSLKSAANDVDTQPTLGVAGPTERAGAEFSRLASAEQLRAVANALEQSGISASVVDSGEQARQAVRSLLPVGVEVYNNTSRTLEAIGVAEDIERSGLYQPLRPRLYQMDRQMQAREMRQLSAAPDWVVGSVHAVTEEGSLLIASASGSQLGPIVSGAGHVILVIGGQKVVPDLNTGLRRIYEYCFPLEDLRARQAYGVPSAVNNVLIINNAVAAGRITAILVNAQLGF